MEALIFPVLLVAVVSILAGLILAFAAKFFAVEVDERVTQIRECLPGANCAPAWWPTRSWPPTSAL